MLSPWTDFDRTFNLIDELRRRVIPFPAEYDPAFTISRFFGGPDAWPRIDLADTGNELRLEAEVPGLSEKDLSVSLHQGVVTLAGERRAPFAAGETGHARERASLKFKRSLALPYKVDADKARATVKDGILTVYLPKAVEAKPRQVPIYTEAAGSTGETKSPEAAPAAHAKEATHANGVL